MALAVHVGCDRSAEGDELSTGNHGRKKSAAQEYVDNLADGDSGFASQQPAFRIEREHPAQPLHIDDAISAVKGRIAIRPSGAARDHRSAIAGDDGGELGNLFRAINVAFGDGKAAPSGKYPPARQRHRGIVRGAAARHGDKANRTNPWITQMRASFVSA